MQLITRRPMNRTDGAWLMAAVIVGIFLSGFAILPEISQGGTRQVTKFNDKTGNWDESVEPAYTKRVTVETNGNVQKIVQAVHDVDPNCSTLVSGDHPTLTGPEFLQILLGGVFAMVMFSLLFRIVVKICHKILGAKTDAEIT
jgi:hypothetical protein